MMSPDSLIGRARRLGRLLTLSHSFEDSSRLGRAFAGRQDDATIPVLVENLQRRGRLDERDRAVLHNVPRGSPDRPGFIQRSGKMQIPFLIDPNTGVSMFESRDIVDYLNQTYTRDLIES